MCIYVYTNQLGKEHDVAVDVERVWINVDLATMAPSSADPYGARLDSAIAVKNGKISAILPMKDFAKEDFQCEIIDGQGGWMTPGLIDAHTHLVFAGNRAQEFERRLKGTSYQEIAQGGGGIVSTVQATRATSLEGLVEAAHKRLQGFLSEGVTAIEIKSGYGLSLEAELKMLRAIKKLGEQNAVRVSATFLGAHALPPEFDNADTYVDMVCSEMIPAVASENLAAAVDVFCEKIAFTPNQCERVFQTAKKHNLSIKAHAEQLSNMGGAKLAADYDALSVDHIEWLDEIGIKAVARSGTVATLLPGAFYFLRETRVPPVELLRKYNIPMAVATDFNPGSSPLASLRLAMNMACMLFKLTPEEALRGVTRSAARALGQEDEIGTLEVGMQADMLLWEIETPAELSYMLGVNMLKQRIIAGEDANV